MFVTKSLRSSSTGMKAAANAASLKAAQNAPRKMPDCDFKPEKYEV